MNWIVPEKVNGNFLDYILQDRKIESKSSFLNPSHDDIHDSTKLYDSEKAAQVILEAIKQNKKIFIHGDFDVDGITATTIMWDFLFRKMKADVIPYIPNRFDEGYGLSESSIESIIAEGGQMIITVDCGVKDIELVKKYKDKIDFVITDHHTLATSESDDVNNKNSNTIVLPEALAVVHPKHPDGNYPFKEICGAMVSWKVCQTIDKVAGTDHDMTEYIELAALGTVCDVMPLIDENRAVVKLGLEKMKSSNNIGLAKLMEIAGYKIEDVDAYHLGFVIGPRLNAAGRLESAIEAVRLLATKSEKHAEDIAKNLNELNIQRQRHTQELLEKADAQIQDQLENKILFAHGEDWQEGIVGLIAGRLTQKYNRPALVASIRAGIVKGSARSPEGINIADVLKSSRNYLTRFGGHAGAAGFSLDHSALSDFSNHLITHSNEVISDNDLIPKLNIDINTDLDALTLESILDLPLLSPFGNSNEAPIFSVLNLKPLRADLVGKERQHLKVTFTDGRNYLDSIGFGMADVLNSVKNAESVDIAGTPEINEWNGNRKVSFKLKAIR